MIRTNAIDKVIRNALGAVAVSPRFPFFAARRRSASIFPIVLGAVGVAVATGVAVVMIWSPRTRARALGIARELPTKVQGTIRHAAIGRKLGLTERTSQPNGLASDLSDYGTSDL